MHVTEHAAVRGQQRGIPPSPFLFELLERFGAERPTGGGATRLYLDRPAKRRLRQFLGGRVYAKLEPMIEDAFVVEKDACAVTLGHRVRPFRAR
jgi:hypothetical protein